MYLIVLNPNMKLILSVDGSLTMNDSLKRHIIELGMILAWISPDLTGINCMES